MTMAASAPKIRGTTRARPAVTPVSPLRDQACFRSSSSPAIQTKIMTAHQATPFRAPMTWALKTKV